MFPYTAPAGLPEVTRFMVSIGAGARTTAPSANWGAARTPSSTHYYARDNMRAGMVLKWVDGEGEEFNTYQRSIHIDVTEYLCAHYNLRRTHKEQSTTAQALNQIGMELAKANLPRVITTQSVQLFSTAYKVHGNPELDPQDGRFVRGIINCARLITDLNLDDDQRLDMAVSGVDPDIITEMRAKGIPLNLITELYGTW